MKKETLHVAFSTQKGGAGKSTLTVLMASYLHYAKDYNVAVIDCDYPQHSIVEMRERDLKMVMEDEHYKAMAYQQFTSLGKKAYPVIESTPDNAMEDAREMSEKMDLDFIFFDLPGTVNTTGIVRTLSAMDYIISPISADRVVLESTLRYARIINEMLISTGKARIKGIRLVWNMVDGREKSEIYDVYEGVIAELGIPVLKTFLPDSKKFRREQSPLHRALFRSTLFPVDRTLLKGSHVDLLAGELLQILK
jgi:cellulose biosynthesis protein BcsQ